MYTSQRKSNYNFLISWCLLQLDILKLQKVVNSLECIIIYSKRKSIIISEAQTEIIRGLQLLFMLRLILQEQSIFKVKQKPQRSLEQNIHPQLRAIKCKMYSSTGITLLVLLAVAGTTFAMAAGELKVWTTDGECFPTFPQQEM